MWIKIIFNIEIKLLVKCKIYVTKVVDLGSRIIEQLSLYFYDFSTIFYEFSKFDV